MFLLDITLFVEPYVLVGHNTIRGAAGASILNAELINDKIL